MNASADAIVLVTGATGTQGGAVARTLRRAGVPVRALIRDPNSEAARKLAVLDVTLMQGSFEDDAALAKAVHGADAVFAVQVFNPSKPDAERLQAGALIAAARKARVRGFVQSSVSGVDLYRNARKSGTGPAWDEAYWQGKADVEQAVQDAGFASAAILRPAFMMENFAAPKAARMFPGLSDGVLRTALDPDTKLALVAADDIGAAAARAIASSEALSHVELAGDLLNAAEIGATLSEAWKQAIQTEFVAPEELLARGYNAGWVAMQHWLNAIGYPARPTDQQRIGLAPTRLSAWASSGARP